MCGATRPRLFWTDFEIRPTTGEVLERGPERNKLKMIPVPVSEKLNFWDEGWGPHADSRHNYPCIVGWEFRTEELRFPRGKMEASEAALQRWKKDHWASGIRFYEDVNVAWFKTAEGICRAVSPTECERFLGFLVGWTDMEGAPPGFDHHNMHYTGKNAVCAFAVPVVARLLAALVTVINFPQGGAFPAFSDPDLMAPYIHDTLDDILPAAAGLAEEFYDLGNAFDSYIADVWTPTLVGPDPGAGGRKNRSQSLAALGTQLGGHLSKNGMGLLVPEERQDPMTHVAAARELQTPPAAGSRNSLC